MLRIVSLLALGIVGAAQCEDCEDMQMIQKELRPSSFYSWKWADLEAQPSPDKKVPVNLQIFAQSSGHASYTKGLLLVDSTVHHGKTYELTSEDCRWHTKRFGSWRLVEGPELLPQRDDDGDEMTALNMTTSFGEQIHVDFLMKKINGFQKIGALYATCKPQQHINMKISMFSKELGLHAPDSEQLGQPAKWAQLGGSFQGSTYLKQGDEGAVAFLKSCSPEEKDEAKATCGKHLGNRPDEIPEIHQGLFAKIFDDCVFDICAGEGESAARLAAAYMKGF